MEYNKRNAAFWLQTLICTIVTLQMLFMMCYHVGTLSHVFAYRKGTKMADFGGDCYYRVMSRDKPSFHSMLTLILLQVLYIILHSHDNYYKTYCYMICPIR